MRNSRPSWQLPRGVSSGTWDYLDEPTIATEYDSFHGEHPLMRLDSQLLLDRLHEKYSPGSSIVADFGCGTARIAALVSPLGYRTLNVDLSRHMLTCAADKLGQTSSARFVQSNLVELDWIRDQSIDVAVCLFSSIGMIRGYKNRVAFLSSVRRSLKPGGMMIVHVHNRGRSWLDPQGPAWLLSTRVASWLGRPTEYGDRIYVYRGLPKMFLHIYSRRELIRDLEQSGFRNYEILPIDVTGSRIMPRVTWSTHWLAGGYFAVAHL